jgi:hypothetical protein
LSIKLWLLLNQISRLNYIERKFSMLGIISVVFFRNDFVNVRIRFTRAGDLP